MVACYSGRLRGHSVQVASISRATALASNGGTALPTCLKPCHFVAWELYHSGKECNRAASRTEMHLSYAG
jgi:hypothetical protein